MPCSKPSSRTAAEAEAAYLALFEAAAAGPRAALEEATAELAAATAAKNAAEDAQLSGDADAIEAAQTACNEDAVVVDPVVTSPGSTTPAVAKPVTAGPAGAGNAAAVVATSKGLKAAKPAPPAASGPAAVPLRGRTLRRVPRPAAHARCLLADQLRGERGGHGRCPLIRAPATQWVAPEPGQDFPFPAEAWTSAVAASMIHADQSRGCTEGLPSR